MEPYVFNLRDTLIGNFSLDLVIDVTLRMIILYFYSLFAIRTIGNRGVSALSPFEVTFVFVLASAVGNPLFFPEISVLHGIFAITLITTLQRVLVYITSHSSKAEDIIEGVTHRIVENGMFDRAGMEKAQISREEVAIKLRVHGATHLGMVKGAYLESTGDVSVFLFPDDAVQPGIRLSPPWDVLPPTLYNTGDSAPSKDMYACHYCGQPRSHEQGETLGTCTRCGKNKWWLPAIKPHVDLTPNPEEAVMD